MKRRQAKPPDSDNRASDLVSTDTASFVHHASVSDDGFCIIEVLFDESARPVDYVFLETNSQFEKHTGIRNAEGRRIREIFPNLEQRWFDIYGRVATTGKSARFENEASPLKRTYSVYAFRIGQPEQHRIAVLFRDITAWTSIEDGLEQTGEIYQLLVENTNEGIIVAQDGRFEFVNRTVGSWLQQSPGELKGAPFEPFIHPDDRQMVADYHKSRFGGEGAPTTYDFRILRKDGQPRWLRNHVVMFEWRGRQAALNFLTDISERKEFELELSAQKTMLQTVLDNIPVMIVVYDLDGKMLSMNAAAEKWLGWTEDEFKMIDVLAAVYPDPVVRDAAWQFMEEAPGEWRDFRICTKSGRYFESSWYNVRVSGEMRIGIGLDISVRKEWEKDLNQAKNQLEIERTALRNKNIALQELITQFENQRDTIQKDILKNLEQTAMPLLRRLAEVAPSHMQMNLELLQQELTEIASPFLARLNDRMPTLSARQREVCRLIKGGMGTKEIASTLNISDATVQKHRELIRKKLGLHGSKVNLESYLQSLDTE